MIPALLLMGVLVLVCPLPATCSHPQPDNESVIELNDLILIQQLSSSRFATRQRAMEELMNRPSGGLIKLLEQAAAESDIEKSSRAVQVLAHFAAGENLDDQARKTIRRLSKLKTKSPLKTTIKGVLTYLEIRQQILNTLFTKIDRDNAGAIIGLRLNQLSRVGLRELTGLLGPLPAVRTIQITGMTQGIELERLKPCLALEELCLSNLAIDDHELRRLPAFLNLKLLTFRNCDLLSGNSIDGLPDFPNLVSIELSRQQASGLKYLRKFEHLTVLVCDATEMSDDDLADIRSFHRLKELSLNNAVKVTDRGLAHLGHLKHLEHIHVSNADLSDECLSALTHLPLRSLSVTGAAISDDCIKHVVHHNALESLSLSNTKIGDDGVRMLISNLRLRSLSLTNTRVSDVAMLAIAKSPSVRKLELMYTNVSDPGLNALAQSKSLEELVVTGTKITDAGLGRINSTSLKFLNISCCAVSTRTVESLRRRIPSLKILMISR